MKTADNLKAAFAGESQARNRYTFFASLARNEGWQEIAEFFEETAGNEMEHASKIMKLRFYCLCCSGGVLPVKYNSHFPVRQLDTNYPWPGAARSAAVSNFAATFAVILLIIKVPVPNATK